MPDLYLFILILVGIVCSTALLARWIDMRYPDPRRGPNSAEKHAKFFDAVKEENDDTEDDSESGGEIRH